MAGIVCGRTRNGRPSNLAVIRARYLFLVDNLLFFPLRRICALGIPADTIAGVRAEMPFVAISTDGASLQRCHLLLVDEADAGAPELAEWIRRRMPRFPVIFWNAALQPASALAEACRRLLFPAA